MKRSGTLFFGLLIYLPIVAWMMAGQAFSFAALAGALFVAVLIAGVLGLVVAFVAVPVIEAVFDLGDAIGQTRRPRS